MSDALAAELAEYEYQIEQISGALVADPENEELLTLKKELQDLADLTNSRLSEDAQGGQAGSKGTAVDSDKKRKHEAIELRKVGDQVLAKWISGDHQFYPARVTSVTGNQTDPVYTVKFLEYNEVQTLHGHQIRSLNEQKKRHIEANSARKTDSSPVPPPPPSGLSVPSTNGSPEQAAKVPVKKKATSSLKEDLAKSANSWNSFAKSGPKTKRLGKRTAIGESSMFRTEEGGRVGVIGSGRAMTADTGKRGRHVFKDDSR